MAEQKVFQSQQDPQWVNKTRTLIVSSRGMTTHQRSFMLDIFSLLPHSKKDFKLEKYNVHQQIEQLCETHKTRYFMYFEVKKKVNFSLWVGRYPQGPSIKFNIDGVVLNKDIKFQGNCVKGSRHILSFDSTMQSNPKLRLAKQLLTGALNVPKMHPKSTSVIDHTLSFTAEDQTINFKNYQIFRQAVNKDKDKIQLFEIGPRFMLNISCILEGVVCGEVLYRAAVVKKILKKAKFDKRKNIKVQDVRDPNMFGEQDEELQLDF